MYQHKSSDLDIRETFYRDGSRIPVPDNIRIEYFTSDRGPRYVVRRDGSSCSNCALSDGGNTLVSHVQLSRAQLGTGRLVRLVIVIYPSTEDSPMRIEQEPSQTGVILWDGASDGSIEVRAVNL